MFPNLFAAATFFDTMRRKQYRPESQKKNSCSYSTYQSEASSRGRSDHRRKDEERKVSFTYRP